MKQLVLFVKPNYSVCPQEGSTWHASVFEYLVTWAIRVRQHQSRPDDVESGIDVHGVWVLKWDDVDLVIWGQMTTHPLNSHVICNLQTTQQNVFKVTTRNSQILLILVAPWTKADVTRAPTALKIFASTCQAGRSQRNSGNVYIYFGSEWTRDGRMDGDEAMYLYVTEK